MSVRAAAGEEDDVARFPVPIHRETGNGTVALRLSQVRPPLSGKAGYIVCGIILKIRPNVEWGYSTRRDMLEPVPPEAVFHQPEVRMLTFHGRRSVAVAVGSATNISHLPHERKGGVGGRKGQNKHMTRGDTQFKGE
jgi:hypothetical protein